MYPLQSLQAIYSPEVTIFKESEEMEFVGCQPYNLNFIACPGIRHPTLVEGQMSQSDLSKLEHKIELIFQIAHRHGHTVLVLGALGCGAWRNNPHDVARTFKSVISRYSGVFKGIFFAIKTGVSQTYTMNTSNTIRQDGVDDNYNIFKQIIME